MYLIVVAAAAALATAGGAVVDGLYALLFAACLSTIFCR